MMVKAQSLSPQQNLKEQRYSFIFENAPVDSVIARIEKKCRVGFSFNPQTIKYLGNINYNFKQESFFVILDSIFHSQGITYTVIGKNIALAKLNPDKLVHERSENIMESSAKEWTGRITDATNGKPVSYVNVFEKNTTTGTMSNLDGNFIIKISNVQSDDSLYFTCLGFKTKSVNIGSLENGDNTIVLQPSTIQIPQITITYTDPHKLINLAVKKINENFSMIPMMYTGFYRESIRQNNNYVMLSEAILKIYKASYGSYVNDQVSIYKSRKSPFVHHMDTINFKFQGGIYTSMMLDIAKNQSTFLAEDYIQYYDFKLEDIEDIEDQPAYVIGFDQKDNVPFPLFKGKLYIDKKSFAVVRADFEVSPKGLDMAANELVKKSPRKIKVKPLRARYLVNYTRHNNRWFLSNIREEAVFRVHKRFSLHASSYHSVAELVITKTDSTDVHHFKYNEMIHPNDIFSETTGTYDAGFWGEYNFIKPEESLEDALKYIPQNFKSIKK